MKTPVKIFINQGCVCEVWSFNTQVDVEVIDLDGDDRSRGLCELKRLEERQKSLEQVWP